MLQMAKPMHVYCERRHSKAVLSIPQKQFTAAIGAKNEYFYAAGKSWKHSARTVARPSRANEALSGLNLRRCIWHRLWSGSLRHNLWWSRHRTLWRWSLSLVIIKATVSSMRKLTLKMRRYIVVVRILVHHGNTRPHVRSYFKQISNSSEKRKGAESKAGLPGCW